MDYKETVELEENIRIKNRANKIYKGFMRNVTLYLYKFKDGRFEIWSDLHNAEYIEIEEKGIRYIGEFLNNSYNFLVTPSTIFQAIKENAGVLCHIEAKARS